MAYLCICTQFVLLFVEIGLLIRTCADACAYAMDNKDGINTATTSMTARTIATTTMATTMATTRMATTTIATTTMAIRGMATIMMATTTMATRTMATMMVSG